VTDPHTPDEKAAEAADTSSPPASSHEDVGPDRERAETLEIERQAREQARVGQAVRGPKP
jgi:hypothetical protein